MEVQGQLRLGRGDFGVNSRRNERFLLALSRAVQEGAFPAAQCGDAGASAVRHGAG